jgi:hypothetical protein
MKCCATALVVAALAFVTGQAQAQGYGEEQAPPTDLDAGGLAPPAPVNSPELSPHHENATEQQLERAEREDSGRGLEFFWLNAEIGAMHLGLQTFSADELVPEVVESTATGPLYGAAVGLRLVFVTLGARFRYATFPDWRLWTLNGELGLRVPLGLVEPYFTFGGGYASLGGFSSDDVGPGLNADDVAIRGFNVRGGFGIDVYVTPAFSLGGLLTGELLVLTRPSVGGSASNGSVEAEVYRFEGSSVGSAVSLTAVAGLHF